MDRVINFFGALPRVTDLLLSGQFAMTGAAKLAEAALGTSVFDGLNVVPTAPASLGIVVQPGQIYQTRQIEESAISGLAVNTRPIVKQGLQLDNVVLTLAGPTTVGYAHNILIEATYEDADADPVLLKYYNAANPSLPFDGPGNSGQSQSTRRAGKVALQAKYGVPATTGSQTTPTPDPGWLPVRVITIAYGQTTVTAGNIRPYPGAPNIPARLPAIPSGVQEGRWTFAQATGTGLALSATIALDVTVIKLGMRLELLIPADLKAGATLNLNGLGDEPILKVGGAPVTDAEYRAGDIIYLSRRSGAWQLMGTGAALNIITTPITRTIYGASADFPTIAAAVAWLSQRRISSTGSVTFVFAGGISSARWVEPASVVFDHPDGNRVTFKGAARAGALPAPATLISSGTSSTARAQDTAANLATLRGVFRTEIYFPGGAGLESRTQCTLQDTLFTSEGVGTDADLIKNLGGILTITNCAAVGAAAGRGFAAYRGYTTFTGTNYVLGCQRGMTGEGGATTYVNGILAAFSCEMEGINAANSSALFCRSANGVYLYARGNGSDGIVASNVSYLFATASSRALDNAGTGFYATNNSALDASGSTASGNTTGYGEVNGSTLVALNTAGANASFGHLGFNAGVILRSGSTASGGTAASSPAVGQTGNFGAQVY